MLLKNMKLLCAAVFAAGAVALNAAVPAMVLEYEYNDNGSISSRTINGAVQKFEYDKRGQLLSVKDKSGNFVERYAYDKAGNILEKEINGKVTKFTYDKANQLVSKTAPDGKVTNYSYDAAGRLVKEGDKEYKYSYLDKLVEVTENGKPVANFDYYVDGQIATATQNGVTENFVWDGLALIGRNATNYINEPAITGGNPILADNKVLFNDMLGSTLGVKDGSKMTQVAMTSFGETSSNDAFFTGKPMIGELGYTFLFRNYRADNGKWQTADPMGYPDGWNNHAYINNRVTKGIDYLGANAWFETDGDTLPAGYFTAPIFINDVLSITVYGTIGGMMTTDGNSLVATSDLISGGILFPILLTAEIPVFANDGTPTGGTQKMTNGVSVTQTATIDNANNQIVLDPNPASDSNSVVSSIQYYDPLLGNYNTDFSFYITASILFMPSGTITNPYAGIAYLSCSWYITCPLGTGCNIPQGTAIIPLSYELKE